MTYAVTLVLLATACVIAAVAAAWLGTARPGPVRTPKCVHLSVLDRMDGRECGECDG